MFIFSIKLRISHINNLNSANMTLIIVLMERNGEERFQLNYKTDVYSNLIWHKT